MALHKEDYKNGIFTVRRGFSAKEEVERTKTGEIHLLPLLAEFRAYIEVEEEKQKRYRVISPYFFVYAHGKKEGKHYTHGVLNSLWDVACRKSGEDIPLYSGLKHSTASQLVNEYGYSIHDLQIAGDWARLESVRKYAKIEVSTRRAILEKKVVRLKEVCTNLERKSEGNNQ
jgi:integrase